MITKLDSPSNELFRKCLKVGDTHGGEDLWGVIASGLGVRCEAENSSGDVPNRVLPTPLLQQEYHECNYKSHKIPFPEERFFPSKAVAGNTLFFYGRLDFREFMKDSSRTFVLSSEVGQVPKCFASFTSRCEPTGRLLEYELRKKDNGSRVYIKATL